LSGVLRMVHTGKVLGAALGSHSKQGLTPLMWTDTWPRYPAVPDSTSGTSAARHSRFTWRRASRLSSPFSTMSKRRKKEVSNELLFTLSKWATILASGRKRSTDSRAT
jgi:hypothetical protein